MLPDIIIHAGGLVGGTSYTNSIEAIYKNIVNKLKDKKIPEGLKHKKIYRPWGHYLSIVEDSRWQVKLIQVKSGEQLSLQMHHHRSEHWVIVEGTAKVEIDSEISYLSENQSTYIPIGSKHRLSNPGKELLTIIEIQNGTYLGTRILFF